MKKLEVIVRNSDRFIALFAPVVIGRSYYFSILVFRQSSENRSNWSDCELAWYRQVSPIAVCRTCTVNVLYLLWTKQLDLTYSWRATFWIPSNSLSPLFFALKKKQSQKMFKVLELSLPSPLSWWRRNAVKNLTPREKRMKLVQKKVYFYCLLSYLIDHFTVVCLVAWPLNESEAGGDLVLIETSLLFSC